MTPHENLQDEPRASATSALVPGATLFRTGETGGVWQVVGGLIRLEAKQPAQAGLVRLALPGDVLGAETILAQPYALTATAVMTCELSQISVDSETHRVLILAAAFLQGQQRSAEAMRLREGSVAERLDRLLRLLSLQAEDDVRSARQRRLPITLKDVALIIDSSPESVCRSLPQRLGARPMSHESQIVNRTRLTSVKRATGNLETVQR